MFHPVLYTTVPAAVASVEHTLHGEVPVTLGQLAELLIHTRHVNTGGMSGGRGHLETDPAVPGLVAPAEDPLELVLAHLGPHQRPAQLHEVLEVEGAVTVRVQPSEGNLHPVIGILDVRAAAREF